MAGDDTGDILKAYDPSATEGPLYQFWLDGGYFTPTIDPEKQPFCIIMPPPNVTGELHLGMFLGNVVLYVPGILWLAYLIGSGWEHPAAHKPLADLVAGSGTWDKALQGGLYPFIVGDLMKLSLASITLPAAWSLVARFKGRS